MKLPVPILLFLRRILLFYRGSSNAKSILDAFNRELIVPDERNILLSDALYNSVVKGSVSRFETFARCPHMHFLNYGMKLKPKGSI